MTGIMDHKTAFELALRLPEWSEGASIRVNGEPLDLTGRAKDGYILILREWSGGDTVELSLEMPAKRVRSHPLVKVNAGKVALQRGPLVYCAEEADNGQGIQQIVLPSRAELHVSFDAALAGGLNRITADALKLDYAEWGHSLYRSDVSVTLKPARATFIPYYAWANRGKGEMAVWVKEQP